MDEASAKASKRAWASRGFFRADRRREAVLDFSRERGRARSLARSLQYDRSISTIRSALHSTAPPIFPYTHARISRA